MTNASTVGFIVFAVYMVKCPPRESGPQRDCPVTQEAGTAPPNDDVKPVDSGQETKGIMSIIWPHFSHSPDSAGLSRRRTRSGIWERKTWPGAAFRDCVPALRPLHWASGRMEIFGRAKPAGSEWPELLVGKLAPEHPKSVLGFCRGGKKRTVLCCGLSSSVTLETTILGKKKSRGRPWRGLKQNLN